MPGQKQPPQMVSHLDQVGTSNPAQAELEALIGTTTEEILASNLPTPVVAPPASAAATVPAPYTSKLEAALDHAAHGFAVFPLRTNGKSPRFEGWQDAATSDPVQIRRWWLQWPQANIGILTTSLLVVDIDPRNDGDASAKPCMRQPHSRKPSAVGRRAAARI
jgi:Bifunctional DNA primase/polymerase, N-terminal